MLYEFQIYIFINMNETMVIPMFEYYSMLFSIKLPLCSHFLSDFKQL